MLQFLSNLNALSHSLFAFQRKYSECFRKPVLGAILILILKYHHNVSEHLFRVMWSDIYTVGRCVIKLLEVCHSVHCWVPERPESYNSALQSDLWEQKKTVACCVCCSAVCLSLLITPSASLQIVNVLFNLTIVLSLSPYHHSTYYLSISRIVLIQIVVWTVHHSSCKVWEPTVYQMIVILEYLTEPALRMIIITT